MKLNGLKKLQPHITKEGKEGKLNMSNKSSNLWDEKHVVRRIQRKNWNVFIFCFFRKLNERWEKDRLKRHVVPSVTLKYDFLPSSAIFSSLFCLTQPDRAFHKHKFQSTTLSSEKAQDHRLREHFITVLQYEIGAESLLAFSKQGSIDKKRRFTALASWFRTSRL